MKDRPERRLHPTPAHLDPGTRTGGGRFRKAGDPASLPRASRAISRLVQSEITAQIDVVSIAG